jgi:hypothetical protein
MICRIVNKDVLKKKEKDWQVWTIHLNLKAQEKQTENLEKRKRRKANENLEKRKTNENPFELKNVNILYNILQCFEKSAFAVNDNVCFVCIVCKIHRPRKSRKPTRSITTPPKMVSPPKKEITYTLGFSGSGLFEIDSDVVKKQFESFIRKDFVIIL